MDPALFRERLVPYAMGRGDISDLIERAVQVAVVRRRAAEWRQWTIDLSQAMEEKEKKVGPLIKYKAEKPAPQSAADKAAGKPPQMILEDAKYPAPVPGMPGFDADLSIWGRPFFNTADGAAAGVAGHQQFMAVVGKPPSQADAICRKMLADLDTRRSRVPADTSAAVRNAIATVPPYTSLVKVDTTPPDMSERHKEYSVEWTMIRTIWDQRAAKSIDEEALTRAARVKAGLPAEQDTGWKDVSDPSQRPPLPSGRELMAGLPLRLAGFAAELEPGWMGGGSAFASSAFREIGVDASHIFETPVSVFEEMVKTAPTGPWFFKDTIYDNFSLGGYVPPQKVPVLIELLEKNRDKLMRAWVTDETNFWQMESGTTDYLKTLEPAMYAASKGWGYLEAAEIYSGSMGWTN